MGRKRLLAAALFCAIGASVQAETLPIDYIVPASSDGAASVHRIAVERFDGKASGALRDKITDHLREATFGPDPWFAVVPEGFASDADSIMTGNTDLRVDARETTPKTVRRCAEKDDKGKCIKESERKIPCNNLVVTVTPAVKLIDRDGREIYRNANAVTESKRFCEDESRPSTEPMIARLTDQIASRIAADLVPSERRADIRVLESRKGLSKADAEMFKNAVKLTKSDAPGACEKFAMLAEANPSHAPSVFNIGLCSEMTGKTDSARYEYERALQLDGGGDYAREAIARLNGNARADRQIAVHYGDE